MSKRILIVDDEIDLLDILAYNLTKNDFEVETATSGEEALILLEREEFSLILLDVMMRGLSGFETAEQIRKGGSVVPIIFLTALDTENDLLRGFSLGADDYIAKPFSVKEVIARVRAVLGRVPKKPELLTAGQIRIDMESKCVWMDDVLVKLTKTEFLLLATLMGQPGRVFSREELLNRVWRGDVFVETRTVDVHIARLRKKLLAAGDCIVNRSGYGYCFEV